MTCIALIYIQLVLATVSGYLAAVWVGINSDAFVQVRNHQGTGPGYQYKNVTQTGHKSLRFWIDWRCTADLLYGCSYIGSNYV